MDLKLLWLALGGVIVGIGASFTGLGGGFLVVPLLLLLGYPAQKAVGTSFLAIVVISLSALVAHNKLANVDFRVGLSARSPHKAAAAMSTQTSAGGQP